MTFDEWLSKTGAHPDESTVTAMRDTWNASRQYVPHEQVSGMAEAMKDAPTIADHLRREYQRGLEDAAKFLADHYWDSFNNDARLLAHVRSVAIGIRALKPRGISHGGE